jgi:energy-coupling factor transporter ATP-binding protein EcfA2
VTIVFVSHDLHAVSRLCDRALLLNRGSGLLDKTARVVEQYVRSATTSQNTTSSEIAITAAELSGAPAEGLLTVEPCTRLALTATYEVRTRLTELQFGFLLHRASDGLMIYDESVSNTALGFDVLEAGDVVSVTFEFDANVTRGQYQLELHVLHTATFTFLARMRPAAIFSVTETQSFAGVAYLAVQSGGRVVARRQARLLTGSPS